MIEEVKDILKDYEKIVSISHAQRLMGWDLETYMPEAGVGMRGSAQAQLSLMEQTHFLSLKERVEKISGREDLGDLEKGIVRVLSRRIHYFSSLPPALVERFDKVASESTVTWRRAKKNSDFSLFKPYLKELVEINMEVAERLGYERNPYNALMDLYEEGYLVEDGDRLFSTLLPASKEILERVVGDGIFSGPHDLENQEYDTASMRIVNEEMVRILQMPLGRFRVDTSTHPFTMGISVNDVRITTRYEGLNFKATMYSTIHESGHAIYELQIPEELSGTPVGHAVSSGIHESQSRFWENFIGRSREFSDLVVPILKKNLNFLEKYSSEDIYRYLNRVSPTMIRVDSDEITYNFHIALRYELEKKLINGTIDPSDAPEIWNDFMEKYVGKRPNNYGEGILQDVHWSGGSFGYFPTYSLGNVVAAMFWHDGNYRTMIKEGRFSDIKGALNEKLHKYGSIYAPKDVLKKSFGEEYNPDHLLSYLKDKYLNA